ncbi:MAG: hypothetical protein A2W01_02485 [Candidatus Solincola sediminis]|nr:MAG: hypothetical protein A2W01_02485 [Candidatus Solincola sediminis]
MIIDNETKEKRKQQLEAELERAVEELKQLPVQQIILIGSMATDTPTALSDIDLIVIMETEDRFLDRLKVAYEKIKPAVAMDILIYTPEEFEEMSHTRPFLMHALKESKVLYAA